MSETNGGIPIASYPVLEKTVLVPDVFTADPSAHVVDGRVVVYCSEDNPNSTVPPDNDGGHFDMKRYRILRFSEDMNVVDDMGPVLHVSDVPWAERQMWAPDAVTVRGKTYLYFPAKGRDGIFRIGVATSDSPFGPFTAEATPIPGSFSIDPAVFVDNDGQAYMYFGGDMGGQLHQWQSGVHDPNAHRPTSGPALRAKVARLSEDMLRFEGPVLDMIVHDETENELQANDVQRRFFEGPWVHKYNDTYYFSYSTGESHKFVYATSSSPIGPWKFRGTVLSPPTGWTTHGSVVEYNNEWYLFYHDSRQSGRDHLRNVKMQRMRYNADGTIQPMSAE